MARGAQKRRKENNFCFNFSINFHSFVSSPFGSSARCRVRSRCLCCRSSIAEISFGERENIFQFNKTGAHTAAAYYAHTKLYILWRASCALNQVQWTFLPRPDDDDDDARWDDVKNLNIMRHDDFFPWEKRRNGPRGLVWTSRACCCNMSKWEIYSSHPSRCSATSSASRNDIKLYLAHFSHRASHLPALDFPHLVRAVMDESLKMIERAQTRKKEKFLSNDPRLIMIYACIRTPMLRAQWNRSRILNYTYDIFIYTPNGVWEIFRGFIIVLWEHFHPI